MPNPVSSCHNIRQSLKIIQKSKASDKAIKKVPAKPRKVSAKAKRLTAK